MNALVSFFGFGIVDGSSAGQAYTVYRTSSSATKKATKVNAKLRGTRTVRYWFNDTRPGRPTQSYAGMAG